jgi:alpha/beta hydrolase family protein
MTTRRDALITLLGTAGAAWPMTGLTVGSGGAELLVAAAQAASSAGRTVQSATLERPSPAKNPPPFVPYGISRPRAADYIEEEWFASGVDDSGRAYKTQIFLYRPQDPARFSGTIIVEPLHAQGAPPIFMYTGAYVMRSGHGWACVGSQKMPLDTHVKPKDPAYYASLNIEAAAAPPGAPTNLQPAPAAGQPLDPAAMAARQAQMERMNQASNAILAQVGAALRSGKGPFQGYKVRHILLTGHSQTGGVVTNYIQRAHESQRLAGGAAVYDGYFPSGAPRAPFGPRDVPLIQVVSDGDVSDGNARGPEFSGRKYRRADSDSASDRYRLYELAGTGHMGTRYPPHNSPKNWADALGGKTDGVMMNSMPHDEQFSMAMHHLVQWVDKGVTPPRAPRLEVAADGRYIAKDENGNSRGGIRSAQMDVPRATYFPNPTNPDGTPRGGVVGTEVPFDAAKMKKLYGTPENYMKRFNSRLDELISQGWFLAADAPDMRAEAARQRF